MKKKLTITIGIPAYNEAGNIRNLLLSIQKQEIFSGEIKKILVVSDASTDTTEKQVKMFPDKRVSLLRNTHRLGCCKTQNVIVTHTSTDVLILLNADTVLGNSHTVEELILPIAEGYDYSIARSLPIEARTFFEKIINYSVYLRTSLFERIRNGDTVYLCGGRGRAMSRRLLRKFVWKDLFTEDAYAYLYCKKNQFRTFYAKNAVTFFRSPSNFVDHIKQSKRFQNAKDDLSIEFEKSFLDQTFAIPLDVKIKTVVEYFFKNPLLFSLYSCVSFLSIYVSSIGVSTKWEQSESTKVAVTI